MHSYKCRMMQHILNISQCLAAAQCYKATIIGASPARGQAGEMTMTEKP